MPFTFSHPAIVLPLVRYNRYFSSTGLIIGSIIPDFESFIRFDEYKAHSHTWPGAFWYDLPLAIIFSLVFHNLIRNELILNLPGSLGSKYYSYIGYNWNKYFRKHIVMVIFSFIIGILSHLLWDSFTHLSISNPDYVLSDVYVGNVKLFILLQYSNSVLGLLIVLWYVYKKDKKTEDKNAAEISNDFSIRTSNEKKRYWMICGIISSLVYAAAVILVPGPINMVLLVDIFISSVLIAIIVAPGMIKGLF